MIRSIGATVLFVNDLDKCIRFYRDTLGLEVTFNDDVSYGLRLAVQDLLLLQVAAAAEMVGEAAIGQATGRVLFCAEVEDVDAEYETLKAKGAAVGKPPKDQAWGRRTAYFADPEGNLWELYKILQEQG